MKYYNVEDVQNLIAACKWRMTLAKERGGEGFVEYDKTIIDVDEFQKRLSTLESTNVSEEDELKFYYVDSIDDYWIGQRLDNFYYAEWDNRLGFVWMRSRYLPWGEHVVAPDTLWKEHTYPSEPREIPFTEWMRGFMKKHTISKDSIIKKLRLEYPSAPLFKELRDEWQVKTEGYLKAEEIIKNASSVISKPKEGKWIRSNIQNEEWICSECGGASWYYDVGKAVSKSNYCPNCGAKMKGIKK